MDGETVNGMTFEAWQQAVNRAIVAQVGMGVDDIADYDYWNAWADGVDATECANEALEAAGWRG